MNYTNWLPDQVGKFIKEIKKRGSVLGVEARIFDTRYTKAPPAPKVNPNKKNVKK